MRVFQLFACALAVIVQLRVLDGDGAVYAIGSRATRGITVQVTDETGAPVDGASVSFRLPEQGPSGAFQGGLRSEVVTTQADGKATVWGMQWNKTPGPVEIRVTAVKDQARAGIVLSQMLSEAVQAKAGGSGTFQTSHHGRNKWIVIGAVAAGAGAGLAFGRSHGSTAAAPTTPSTVIGLPTVNVQGHP